MAAKDTKNTETSAFQGAVLLNRLFGIFRTSRIETATTLCKNRDVFLIEVYTFNKKLFHILKSNLR